MESVPCNLCGSEETRLISNLADWSLNHPDVLYTYVKCNNCGLVFQNPRPTSEEIFQFYPDNYECYTVKSISRRNTPWLLTKAMQYGMKKRVAKVTRFKKQGRLLDIGCATGVFLDAMRDLAPKNKGEHWDLQGVEISSYAAEIGRAKGFEIFTGRLMDAHFLDEYFDAVTLWDVFEHLHNPKGDLCEINRILKRDGILVMRIPNLDSWDAKIFGKFWAGYEPPRHLYLFGKDTITQMVEGSGFKVIEMDANSSRYLTFVLSLHFYLVGKKVSPRVINRINKVFNHPISRLIFAPIFFFYGAGLRGPLMTIIARKD